LSCPLTFIKQMEASMNNDLEITTWLSGVITLL
jgi:hypothetical protein